MNQFKPFITGLIMLLGIIAAVVFLNDKNPATVQQPVEKGPVTSTPSASQPVRMAEQWIKEHAWTYVYDGRNLQLKKTETTCLNCYRIAFTFDSTHGGYGDRRTDSVQTQVITPHTVVVDIRDGTVIGATTDGVFDEFHQTLLAVEGVETQTMIVQAFFPNNRLDPEISCTKAFVVTRTVVKTPTTARAALNETLKGPTPQEKKEGYFTSIPPGVVIQKLTIENGVAKVDFNSKLDEGVGGSCRVSSIRAQINETLKQFPSVTSVVISIDGRTDDILQP